MANSVDLNNLKDISINHITNKWEHQIYVETLKGRKLENLFFEIFL